MSAPNFNNNNNNSSSASSQLNFGCLIPGRFPITGAAFRQVSPRQWMTPIGQATDNFSVFLISDSEPLPDNMGLACYLCRCEDQESWTYVGHLLNNRPSATLKAPAHFLENHRGVDVFLGISLQPIDELKNFATENELELQKQARAARLDTMASKVAEDFYNFVSSFAKTEQRRVTDCGDDDCHGQEMKTEEVVVLPLNWVNRWRQYITGKIQRDQV